MNVVVTDRIVRSDGLVGPHRSRWNTVFSLRAVERNYKGNVACRDAVFERERRSGPVCRSEVDRRLNNVNQSSLYHSGRPIELDGGEKC
jgi:hypothetical protein